VATDYTTLQTFSHCSSATYVDIEGCSDCADLAPLDKLTTISGKNSGGTSINIKNNDNLVSLGALSLVTGQLQGMINIHNNAKLESLEGLQGITGTDKINIDINPKLESVLGLRGLACELDRFYVYYNKILNSLDGLQGVTGVTGVVVAEWDGCADCGDGSTPQCPFSTGNTNGFNCVTSKNFGVAP